MFFKSNDIIGNGEAIFSRCHSAAVVVIKAKGRRKMPTDIDKPQAAAAHTALTVNKVDGNSMV